MRRPSLAFAITAVYVALCLAAVGYIVWASVVMPGRFELAGVMVVLLGAPWSVLFGLLIAALGSSNAWLLAGEIILSCVLNAWLLHRLASRFSLR